MENDKEEAPVDLSQIDAIASLDTARMALRWALERLRLLERQNGDLKKKADWEFKMRMKAEEDFKIQSELEKTHMDEILRMRREELDRSFGAKLANWERDYQMMSERLQKEKQALERQEREFEQFCAAQKASVKEELVRLEHEAGAKTASSTDAAEAALVDVRERHGRELERLREKAANFERAENAWLQERTSLGKELEGARERTRQLDERIRDEEEKASSEMDMRLESARRSAQEIAEASARLADLHTALEQREKTLAKREKYLQARAREIVREFREKRAELGRLKKEAKTAITRMIRERKTRPRRKDAPKDSTHEPQ